MTFERRTTLARRGTADLLSDLRHAIRTLRRSPGYASVVVLMLSLGIGVNTAIFSLVYSVLVRPLPFPDSDRLVRIVEHTPATAPGGARRTSSLYTLNLGRWEGTDGVTAVAAYDRMAMTLTGSAGAHRLTGYRVSPSLFRVLGAPLHLGRPFDAPDATPPAGFVILSHATWRDHFGADETIIGETVTLGGRPYTVIGVTSQGFSFPDPDTQFWLPLLPALSPVDAQAAGSGEGRVRSARMLARLRDGVSIEAAAAALNTSYQPLPLVDANALTAEGVLRMIDDSGRRVELIRLQDEIVAPVRPALLVLTVAVALVLLIACANVANLTLARLGTRQAEFAVQAALGAGRSRMVRQRLTESLVLSLAGGVGGAFLAYWGVRLLVLASPDDLPRFADVRVDSAALLFTLAAALVSGILSGLLPALRFSRVRSVHPFRSASGRPIAGPFGGRRIASTLLVFQIGMAVVVLIAAGLLSRSFVALSTVDLGFDPDNGVTFQLILPEGAYADPWVFAEQLLERLEGHPDVRVAAAASFTPFRPGFSTGLSFVEIADEATDQTRMPRQIPVEVVAVSPDYFAAMGIDVLEGRSFSSDDRAGAPHVLIVNQSFVDEYHARQSPLGLRLRHFDPALPWEVVGVVGDIRRLGLDTDPAPVVYTVFPQRIHRIMGSWPIDIVLRTEGAPLALIPSVRQIIADIDPRVPMDPRVTDLRALVATQFATPRFYAFLMLTFAMAAVVLASLGIYALVSHLVHARTREIGIRMALGARPGQVVAIVLRHVAVLTAIGLVAGSTVAMAVTRYMDGLLSRLTPLDPVTFLSVPILFSIVAAAAAWLPARWAARLDPLIALRDE